MDKYESVHSETDFFCSVRIQRKISAVKTKKNVKKVSNEILRDKTDLVSLWSLLEGQDSKFSDYKANTNNEKQEGKKV